MKPFSGVAGLFFVAMVSAFACSSTPSRPPIETTGNGAPGSGGGGSPAGGGGGDSDGGGSSSSGEGGTAVSADGGSSCLSGSCLGCCTATNVCESGSSNSACGVLGVFCNVCTTGQTCVNGNCATN